jgi:hypothetical protein
LCDLRSRAGLEAHAASCAALRACGARAVRRRSGRHPRRRLATSALVALRSGGQWRVPLRKALPGGLPRPKVCRGVAWLVLWSAASLGIRRAWGLRAGDGIPGHEVPAEGQLHRLVSDHVYAPHHSRGGYIARASATFRASSQIVFCEVRQGLIGNSSRIHRRTSGLSLKRCDSTVGITKRPSKEVRVVCDTNRTGFPARQAT